MASLTVFAKRIKNLRVSAGLKQSELAEKLGVSRSAIGLYENGDRTPDIDFALNAAKYFCVSTDWLLGLSDYKRHDSAKRSVEDLGLSERATDTLVKLSASGKTIDANMIAVFNLLLEDHDCEECGSRLLRYMADYLFAQSVPRRLLQFTSQGVRVLDPEPGIEKLMQDTSDVEFIDVLYHRFLLDRVTRAIEEIRFQLCSTKPKEDE